MAATESLEGLRCLPLARENLHSLAPSDTRPFASANASTTTALSLVMMFLGLAF
jgi:hypothetical protein